MHRRSDGPSLFQRVMRVSHAWALVLAVMSAQADAAVFSIVDLGSLGGGWSSGAALNNSGDVAGMSRNASGETRAFLYRSGSMIQLPLPAGFFVGAMDDAGTVAGTAGEGAGASTAFLHRDGVTKTFSFDGVSSLAINAVDIGGTMVGSAAFRGSGAPKAIAVKGGAISDLGTLGGTIGVAYGLNTTGQIVGAATTAGDVELHPVLWTAGQIIDLGFPGVLPGRMLGAAHGINGRGQVVGDFRGSFIQHAFLWEDGVVRDLDSNPGHNRSLTSINAQGDAVGPSAIYLDGYLHSLDALLNPYTEWRVSAVSINDQGVILANGCRGVNTCRALLLTRLAPPPPPPAGQVNVIEYYDASRDHFFMTALAAEIEALDSGRLAGWARTGEYFRAYAAALPGTSPVCRFYIPAGLGDSHFFSASPGECAATHAAFPDLVHETDAAFHIALPDVKGACPEDKVVVHRLWSQRADSNHRYTTQSGVRDNMVRAGWLAEGNGPELAVMCAPRS